jgi:ATP synthase protein I
MTSIGNGAASKANEGKKPSRPSKASKPTTIRAQQARESRERSDSGKGLEVGWTVFSYLVGGLIGYGAIGWLIARAVHIQLLFPLGMLVGLAISLSYVIYRYGRQGSVERNDR